MALAEAEHAIVQNKSWVFASKFIGYQPHRSWLAFPYSLLLVQGYHGFHQQLRVSSLTRIRSQKKSAEHLAKSGFQGYPAGARWASTKGIAGAGRSSVVS